MYGVNYMTNIWFDVAEVSVGQHWYWEVGGYSVHGQVLVTSWFVLFLIAAISFLGAPKAQTASDGATPSAPVRVVGQRA